jgi:hypothetical protein
MIRQLHQQPELRYQHLLEVTGYPQGTAKQKNCKVSF